MGDSMYFRRKNDGSLGESYLIQRLQKPFQNNGPLEKFASAFSFGGGLGPRRTGLARREQRCYVLHGPWHVHSDCPPVWS